MKTIRHGVVHLTHKETSLAYWTALNYQAGLLSLGADSERDSSVYRDTLEVTGMMLSRLKQAHLRGNGLTCNTLFYELLSALKSDTDIIALGSREIAKQLSSSRSR